jgi:hypothetical protein
MQAAEESVDRAAAGFGVGEAAYILKLLRSCQASYPSEDDCHTSRGPLINMGEWILIAKDTGN